MIPFIKVNVYEQVNFFRVIVLSGSERRFDNKGPAVKSRKTAICIKLQRNRAQLQAAGFFTAVELPVTVEVVTEQGMAKGSQMGSDLMGTTGDQMNPETGNGTAFQGFITGDDRLGIRFGTIGYADFCAAGILDQPGTALGLLRLHDPPDQADIILFQFTLTKNILQNIQDFRCLRKQAEAAGFIIQTMTGGRGKSIRIMAPDKFPAEIREGNTAAGIRFHTDAGALVDKQHVIILIDNRKGRNGCIISGNRIRQIDLQAAAFRQPVIP